MSLAVGIVLFEAGLRLSFDEIAPRVRGLVVRLIAVGVIVTLVIVALTADLLFDGMDTGVAVLIGAILVVSGPTVVLPLLGFIRPARGGAHAAQVGGRAGRPGGRGDRRAGVPGRPVGRGRRRPLAPGEFVVSIGVGAAVGVVGAALLLVLLREVQREAPGMVVSVTLATVVGAVVAADLLRDDSGFVAATLMGVALGNQRFLREARRIDVSAALGFHEALVQLLIGVLFVLIAASVSPDDVRHVLARTLVLVAVMVLGDPPAGRRRSDVAVALRAARACVRRLDGAAGHRRRRHVRPRSASSSNSSTSPALRRCCRSCSW